MYVQLFSIIAPVFVCAAIGYTWGKGGHAFPDRAISTLIAYFGTPCLIFNTLTTNAVELSQVASMVAMAVAAITVFTALSLVILKLLGLSYRAFLPSLMFPNAGNMGLPICLFAFGEEGLALGIAYFLVTSIGQFTIGLGLAAGAMSWRELSRSSVVYAVLAALAFLATDTATPVWLANTTRLLGGMTIPLLLIVLGNSLSTLTVRGLGKSFGLSVLRLTMGFTVGVLLAQAAGFEGSQRGVLILQSTMPISVFSYLFAKQYETDPQQVAGMAVISTVISFATMPLLLLYVL